MSTENIKVAVRQYVIDALLNGDDRGLEDDLDLQTSGILDSFGTIELVAFIEEAFGVKLDAAAVHADAFKTIDAITATISGVG